ncbi:MAG: CmpA/NrtA family ABC transporter substrate-binding protein [Pseudomonadota bacterium]
MTLDHVPCGFIPLTDSAVLVAAVEMGFAAAEGIALDLKREASWSNIRDRIAMGVYPVAHMLSPMAVSMSLGLGPLPVRIDAPFVMNQNGNVLTARAEIAAHLADLGATPRDPAATGAALRALTRRSLLRIGVPFPHSMHLLLTRYLLEASGADLSRVTFAVAPPPILPDMMRAGEVDAFMVGEPWGSLAVERGDACILLPGQAIWAAAPEKVLGTRRDWIEDHPDVARRLLRAMHRAAKWCSDAGSASVLAEILAMPHYVNAPADLIQRGLDGQIVLNSQGDLLTVPGFARFGGGAVNFPWRSAGMWIADQAAQAWGIPKRQAQTIAHDAFRSDLYRLALAQLDPMLPAASMKVEGSLQSETLARAVSGEVPLGPDSFFDARVFEFDA